MLQRCLFLGLLCTFSFLLCAELGQAARRRIPRWHLRMAQKQGPNTCAVEEVPALDWKLHTECKYWMHRKVCGFKTLIRYECCEGFSQVHGEHGCTAVMTLSNVTRLSRQLGASIFADYLQQSGLEGQLGPVVTLFAPRDAALLALTPQEKEAFEAHLEDNLLQHVFRGRARIHEVESRLPNMQGGFLHVNRYSNGITTVNCVPVLRRDHEATDGLVHLLEGILSPASTASLPQLLMEDGRFREMARMMLRSEALVAQLRREPGPFTLLAPSDEAFQAMPPGQLQRISQDLNVTADLIRNHIVPRSLCAPAIIAEHRVKSLSGDKLELSCNASGVYANEHRFTGEMMLGGNGHISVLTGILMTDKARSLVDLMAQRSDRLSTFVSLLADSGLASELSEGSFTVFAPTDDAFERVSLPTDSEALKKLLQRHLVPDRKIMSESFWDDAKLDTLEGGATLRLKVYRKSLGVDTAIITESDVEGHNGVVHVVNRVLEPPQGSVMEVLEKDDRFSLFAQALKRARELQLVNNHTQTVFAPTNEALSDYATDLENPRILENVVLSHIVDGLVPTGSFQSPKLSYDLVSERAHPLRVRMRGSNLTVNGVHVLRPDLLARDGLVHCVNGVLLPPSTEPGKDAGGN